MFVFTIQVFHIQDTIAITGWSSRDELCTLADNIAVNLFHAVGEITQPEKLKPLLLQNFVWFITEKTPSIYPQLKLFQDFH
jgi:hypothetical protein